ncbi:hypothetical protein UFOVP89_53 [uncultured Caudovirales phage]|uniref:Uncharacterized protein n=1 Tax=uncultured Caudovirales phage TaxID=2100421 RepID=A0A6J5L338_9CAUD|nr:hypothetical protein UFOVP89_53 [uncultured Caudovirales phage]
MGMPMIIGAGVGALGSAAMGKSPFTGALLGGALGGLGGAGGLFGGAAGSGAGVSGLSAAAPAAATAGEIAIPSTSLLGAGAIAPSVGIPASALESGIGMAGLDTAATAAAPAMGVQLSAAPSLGALDYSIGAGNTLAAGQSIYQAPSLLDKLSSMPTKAMDYVKENPYQSANMAMKLNEAANPPQQPIQPAAGMQPIQRGNFDPSSTLLNVSPNMGMSKEEMLRSKAGQYASAAHISDADKRKIGDFYTSLIG